MADQMTYRQQIAYLLELSRTEEDKTAKKVKIGKLRLLFRLFL